MFLQDGYYMTNEPQLNLNPNDQSSKHPPSVVSLLVNMIVSVCSTQVVFDMGTVNLPGIQIRVPWVRVLMTFSETVPIPIPLSAIPIPTITGLCTYVG